VPKEGRRPRPRGGQTSWWHSALAAARREGPEATIDVINHVGHVYLATCRSCAPTSSSCVGKRLAAVVLCSSAHDHLLVSISDCITSRVSHMSGEVGKGGVMWGGVRWGVRTQRFLEVFEESKGKGKGGPYGR
jgi:hypothetical protein